MEFLNRNLAILSDENIITVGVQFPDNTKVYRYLAMRDWDIQLLDTVLVPSGNVYKTVRVVAVDDEADIDPALEREYIFCCGTFIDPSIEAKESLKGLQETVSQLRKKHMRRQLREQLLHEHLLEDQSEQVYENV